MARRKPGTFDTFKGLWARGHKDSCPPDHFIDCLNTIYSKSGVEMRDGLSQYMAVSNIIRMHLYKPNPPFTGTNVPRIIALKNNGDLVDLLLSTIIYSNVAMTDFALVNFFGRCYISPSNGKTGLSGVNVKVYKGSGVVRDAGGIKPVTAPTLVYQSGGTLSLGIYLFAVAFEYDTGFISSLSPVVYGDNNNFPAFSSKAVLSNIPIGGTGVVKRHIIANKVIPYPTAYNGNSEGYPMFFAKEIPDNTTTTTDVSFFDEQLVESADYLRTLLSAIPAGVGLMDYKGRMISYGEATDPSIVRASFTGEPEQFSATSGFFITDPTDSTGVRGATEFRNSLYVFKATRGYITEDNLGLPSTWPMVNFEKSEGTEQYGISAVLDAKGSSSEGYIIASLSGLNFFNGTFIFPELSYKITDLWDRINKNYFHKVQVTNDPINKRVYVLVPLDANTSVSHILYGDYSDGLNANAIKWSLWEFVTNDPTSILIYLDFTGDIPSLVTRLSNLTKIYTLNIDIPSNDDGAAVDSYFQLPPVRYSSGISQYDRVRIRGQGPCNFAITAFGQDEQSSFSLVNLNVPSALPGREYAQLINLVSEHCSLKFRVNTLNEKYKINHIILEGMHLWDERPR